MPLLSEKSLDYGLGFCLRKGVVREVEKKEESSIKREKKKNEELLLYYDRWCTIYEEYIYIGNNFG